MENTDFAWEDPEEVMKELHGMQELFVPEWKLDFENPDMGTVLAVLFADMMAGTARRFTQAVKRYPLHFYNMLGAELLPSKEAEGYITFQTVNDEVSGAYVAQGTKVSGSSEQEQTIVFETAEDIYVSPARLKTVCYVEGKQDFISRPLSFPLAESELSNCQSHVLYIGHPFLFRIRTDGGLIIDFHAPSYEREKMPPQEAVERIQWSYYSSGGFVPFQECSYEDGRLYLYKSREMPVFAQTVFQGTDSFWLRAAIEGMKSEEEIAFPNLSLWAQGSYLEPELIYDGNMELDKEDFMPFGNQLYVYQEFFICSEEVFSKRGAQIALTFELEFSECPGALKSPELPIHWKNIMRSSDFPKAEPVNVSVTSLSFEYYNGLGFTRIPGTKIYAGIFDESAEEGKKRLVFRCPEDICAYMVSAQETWCIRIRVSGLSAAYPMDGVYRVPRLKNMMLSYRYERGLPPERVFCINQLLTKRLPCEGKTVPFFNSFPEQEMLYLAFSRPLNEEGISLLFCMEDEQQEVFSRCRYEYYGKNGWNELNVFDGTYFMSRTGTLSMTEQHVFEEKDFFGCQGFWIRILWESGPQDKRRRFTAIRAVHMNSVAAGALPGSGESGNLPAGEVNTLERSIGFINKVENKEPMAGGCRMEDTGQAVVRCAAVLRHRDRAVTAKDFEDIINGRLRNIRQVRCFPGRNELGDKVPGHITLAVLPQEGETHFEQVRKSICDCLLPYMESRMLTEGRLHIVEPEWVSVRVYMSLAAAESIKSYQLRDAVIKRINTFLDPVSGNFDKKGWKIGTLPTSVQISNACEQMEEVLYISHISLDIGSEAGIYALGLGGEHEIQIL